MKDDVNDQQNIDAVAAAEIAQRLLDAVNVNHRWPNGVDRVSLSIPTSSPPPDDKKIIKKTAVPGTRRVPFTYSPGGSSHGSKPVSSGVKGLKEMNARVLVKKILRKKVQDNRR